MDKFVEQKAVECYLDLSSFNSLKAKTLALNHIVRDPADIGKTSAAFWAFSGALTSIGLLFGYNFIYDGGSAVLQDVLLDI